jgi:ankyrin repeat protein
MRSSAVIFVSASVLWGHAGPVGSVPAAAAEPPAGSLSREVDGSPPAVVQEKKTPEKIRVGDSVVVVADEAEVTWEGKVIARIPRGGTFRVLRVGGDAVAGWIKILNRQDIDWTRRGYDIGWVRLDQVARAKPGAIDPAASGAARATPPVPPTTPAPQTAPRTTPPEPMPRGDQVPRGADRAGRTLPVPETSLPPVPADVPAKTERAFADTPGVERSHAGHFSCGTFDGTDRDLCVAVSDNHRDEVARLLAAGANINARSSRSHTKGMTLLMLAVWYGWDREVVELLIESGADINARDNRGNTALIYSAKARPQVDFAVAELLIKGGADMNAKGEDGMTALMHAAMHDDSRLAQRLIEARADVAARDARGWTALMHATRKDRGNPAIVKLLIEAGAEVNAAHHRGGTALSSACYNGHATAVTLLLKAGADVNMKDEAGWTPLICACLERHTPIIKLLLAAGADVNAKDKTGRTPLRVASDIGDRETVRALSDAGAVDEDWLTGKAGAVHYGILRPTR